MDGTILGKKYGIIDGEGGWGKLTPATADTLGGIMVGDGLSVTEAGVLSVDEELPEEPAEDGVKVLTATTVEGVTTLTWEEPASGFNLPILCSYGSASGISGVSAKYNYWFGIYASSGHQKPAISAGSNCTVEKLVDNSEPVEDAFSLYKIEKTSAASGASISESNVDAKSIFGVSELYNLGEFVKSNGNVGSLQVTTNKPILVCMQSGLSSSIYPIVGNVTKGKDSMLTRCQYGSYDNGEVHIIFPEDGEIDVTFTHNTIFAYAEISE